MTRPACARVFQCQDSYRQALAVQGIMMLYPEAGMDKVFLRQMNTNHVMLNS